jgi:hypothetical protein
VRTQKITIAAAIVVFGSSALLAQSKSTAELTITVTVVPSVTIAIPEEGQPQIEVANTTDRDDTFVRVSPAQPGLRASGRSLDTKGTQTRPAQTKAARPAFAQTMPPQTRPAQTKPEPAISFDLPVHADHLSRTKDVHVITDAAGHPAVLQTTTIVME